MDYIPLTVAIINIIAVITLHWQYWKQENKLIKGLMINAISGWICLIIMST